MTELIPEINKKKCERDREYLIEDSVYWQHGTSWFQQESIGSAQTINERKVHRSNGITRADGTPRESNNK